MESNLGTVVVGSDSLPESATAERWMETYLG